MSETKRTVEGRECCYCHRNLPITYFPLKPGMKYARYKACRDCHPLGHSCIPKQKPEPKPKRLKVLKPPTPKRRKFATDEERKAAQLEYQRRYREKHRDRKRESTRKSYYRRKGEEPPEEPQKRGPSQSSPKRSALPVGGNTPAVGMMSTGNKSGNISASVTT